MKRLKQKINKEVETERKNLAAQAGFELATSHFDKQI
jgi:hypothetical protein